MADLILHHYTTSPFSEKVRLILGAKKLPWKSVFIPPIMPKPDVEALTGGYRKTPFLQIGADMYCDSALIADVLEHLQPEPTLYPEPEKGLSRILAQWADTTLFWAAMAWNLQPKGAAEVFAKAPPEAAKAFGEDRGKMSAGNMTRLRPADATSAYKSYLRRLSDMLDDRHYLLGEVPSITDFSVYHPLWYTRRIESVRTILDLTPAVVDWMDRMAAIGHGAREVQRRRSHRRGQGRDAPHAADRQHLPGRPRHRAWQRRDHHAESFGLEKPQARWWPPRARTTRWSAARIASALCMCTFRASAMC
jgi:glutathione S-transferase